MFWIYIFVKEKYWIFKNIFFDKFLKKNLIKLFDKTCLEITKVLQ